MIGQLLLSSVHRGTSFTETATGASGVVYLLCNGQSVPRDSYPLLSSVWPSLNYTSDETNIHLPDLGDQSYALRHVDFALGVDVDASSRHAISGVGPIASTVGSAQYANMASHTHGSGALISSANTSAGPSSPTSIPVNADVPTQGVKNLTQTPNGAPVASGAALSTAFDVAHTKFYPYIQAT